MRRVRFRPGLRETMAKNMAYLAAMSQGGVLPDALQRSYDASLPPPKRTRAARAAPRDLEGPVVQATSSLLRVHPRVLFAVRQNTGQASYESKTGKYVPVAFYRILTHGKEITVVDFWGIMRDGRFLAIEAKRPGWKKPSTETEYAQANFLAMIRNNGGIGIFATSAEDVAAALK